jgi:hypothetical protein
MQKILHHTHTPILRTQPRKKAGELRVEQHTGCHPCYVKRNARKLQYCTITVARLHVYYCISAQTPRAGCARATQTGLLSAMEQIRLLHIGTVA